MTESTVRGDLVGTGLVAGVFADGLPVGDLMEAFAETVRTYPDRPAIVHNGQPLSYSELDLHVRSTAETLGSAPGAVGVLTSRAPVTVISLLGVLAAGGAYCPVDPSFPEERRRAMVAAAGCRTVLGANVADFADIKVLDPSTDLGSAAYVLFTSGSTGEPKPVLTPRVAISTAVAALRGLFGLTPADRVLQFASLNWDTCFEEILPTLTAGATLVFDDEAYTGSFSRFLRMVAERGVTVLDLPTAFWHELVRHLAEDRAALPECLRLVVIGGEAAAPARLADWRGLDTAGIRLVNTYGCTETTLVTHAVDLAGPHCRPEAEIDVRGHSAHDVQGSARIPIGRALPHVRELITSEGELLIGGPALALGYLGRPEATDERFVELADGRFFRTGDRVSRDSRGLLVHEGRLDHQIKVRGVRVEPGEVEAQLVRHPAVVAAAVTGMTRAGRTVLVGYVVARNADDDLLGWLRQRVPAHLVPSRITFVPELALTASGKVDRAGTHRRFAIEHATEENPR